MIAEIRKLVNSPLRSQLFSPPPHPKQRGLQALEIGKLLETPMDLTFDPVSAAWDTFRFWDNHETSTDHPICHISGTCRRSRYRPGVGVSSHREKASAAGRNSTSYGPTNQGQRPFR